MDNLWIKILSNWLYWVIQGDLFEEWIVYLIEQRFETNWILTYRFSDYVDWEASRDLPTYNIVEVEWWEVEAFGQKEQLRFDNMAANIERRRYPDAGRKRNYAEVPTYTAYTKDPCLDPSW